MSAREDPHLLSGAYALDAVTPEEAAAMERAMASSEDLRSEVAELTDTAVLLGLSVAPVEPPPALRSRLLDAIETTPQLPAADEAEEEQPAAKAATPPHLASRSVQPSAHLSGRPARAGTGPRGRSGNRAWLRRPGTVLAAIAAAAVLLFGAGVLVDNIVRPSSSGVDQAVSWSQLTRASDVRHSSAPVAGGGSVAVYWSQKLGASAVTVHGPTAPAGKVMQLWRMQNGTATSAGLWHPAAGQDHQVIRGSMHSGQTFGITIEPAGGSKKPTTTPVVTIPIT